MQVKTGGNSQPQSPWRTARSLHERLRLGRWGAAIKTKTPPPIPAQPTPLPFKVSSSQLFGHDLQRWSSPGRQARQSSRHNWLTELNPPALWIDFTIVLPLSAPNSRPRTTSLA